MFSVFFVFKNTRKVFSEYHNVPMDSHKVFTALGTVGFCSPLFGRVGQRKEFLVLLLLRCVGVPPPSHLMAWMERSCECVCASDF
ncbi:hypothetical protein ACE6H2_016337 [Prunus campanulata]